MFSSLRQESEEELQMNYVGKSTIKSEGKTIERAKRLTESSGTPNAFGNLAGSQENSSI
jgi:hypothetical protein